MWADAKAKTGNKHARQQKMVILVLGLPILIRSNRLALAQRQRNLGNVSTGLIIHGKGEALARQGLNKLICRIASACANERPGITLWLLVERALGLRKNISG